MSEIVKEEKCMDLNRRFNREKLKKFQILNGAQLKYIAFFSMLIDHVNNGVVSAKHSAQALAQGPGL